MNIIKLKWRVYWIHDALLNKRYNNVANKQQRPIMIYSADRKWSGRVLYFEMSSHSEKGNPSTSIKLSSWKDKNNKTKESWVLINRFGLLPIGTIWNLKRERDCPLNCRKLIKDKFEELVTPQLFYENKSLKQQNQQLQNKLNNLCKES